jgi:anti-anti-sigma factor
VVRLIGDIDISNVDTVSALSSHPSNGHGVVVFDLAELTFIGSVGIRALMAVAAGCTKFGCRNASSVVDRVLHVTGLAAWLEVP